MPRFFTSMHRNTSQPQLRCPQRLLNKTLIGEVFISVLWETFISSVFYCISFCRNRLIKWCYSLSALSELERICVFVQMLSCDQVTLYTPWLCRNQFRVSALPWIDLVLLHLMKYITHSLYYSIMIPYMMKCSWINRCFTCSRNCFTKS